MDSFTERLEKSQQSLQHVMTVILERMFASIYVLYYNDRPGYVTCCGIIGSAMFWIGGYLLLYPPSNILTDINHNIDINIHYLASNILPFQTFIHIALLFLASITYWKIQNILSFCMTKCGCFYLFIHSISSLILITKYLYLNHHRLNYDFIFMPLTFIFWFLIPSFFGFIIVRKEHKNNDELQYKWKQIRNQQYQRLDNDNNEYNEEEDNNNNIEIHDQSFIRRQFWVYYVYIFLAINVMWYILYISLQCYHNMHIISDLPIGEWLNGYTQSFTMSFHRAFILSCIYNIIFRPWCHNTVYISIGATLISFVLNIGYLSLHFNFTNPTKLNIDTDNYFYSILSFILILTKCIILSGLLFCEYQVYKLLSIFQDEEYNKNEIVRKRPTMFDILYNFTGNGSLTRKQKFGLYLIIYSSTAFIISMQMEVIFMLYVATYLFGHDSNPWEIFNKLLLWSFHLMTIYVHAIVVSVQFNDSYIRASKLLAALNVALLIFAIWNVYIVSYSIFTKPPDSKYLHFDYIVILFCIIRSITSLSAWIGFSKLKTIQPFQSQTFNYNEITTNNDKNQQKLSKNYIIVYGILLFIYYLTCLYRYEWNGNLFILNDNNWAIICSETPEYGLLFHSGLLNIIFIFDAGISRRWSPTWDLSRTFLLSITCLGTLQIINCILLYCGDIYAYTQCEILLFPALLIWILISFKMCLRLHSLDNLFLFKPKLFI